jgi:hypothetical protein
MPEKVPASRPPDCTTDLLSARDGEVSKAVRSWTAVLLLGETSRPDCLRFPPRSNCRSDCAIDLLDWGLGGFGILLLVSLLSPKPTSATLLLLEVRQKALIQPREQTLQSEWLSSLSFFLLGPPLPSLRWAVAGESVQPWLQRSPPLLQA